jgi:hypothetical protein
MKAVKVTTKMSGKMSGMVSINTSPKSNDYCNAMAKTSAVCGSCYSHRLMSIYKTADACFTRNGEALSSGILAASEVPRMNAHTVRFNAHGELINMEHLINLGLIACHNPKATFTLWTKRKDIVEKWLRDWGKPPNMILIYSSPKLDRQSALPIGFDKVFTVYGKDTQTDINCGTKNCADCMTCYTLDDKTVYVNERLK